MSFQTIKRLPGIRSLYRLEWLVSAYHLALAFLGALRYGFPSRKLIVIGVTGTKGKTTTCNLIAQLLNAAGRKTGLVTTVNFSTGDREWTNDTKQTMPGRFALQRLLWEMVRSGCTHAVVETSSEGILQHRHRFINYRVAVFTNLSPEHIERHGSFEAYRAAKVKLFEYVAKQKDGVGVYPHTITKLANFFCPGRKASCGVGVYNLDDENDEYFLQPAMPIRYGYSLHSAVQGGLSKGMCVGVSNVTLGATGTTFIANGTAFEMPLIGEFNVYNAAAAVCVALSQGVSLERIKSALRTVRPTPGRLEVVDAGQRFTVIVDYAHEPASLSAVYVAARLFEPRRTICLLGSQGGGRDVWKRAEMGKIAARHCDEIILTNEDPYDENPARITSDIEAGIWMEPHPRPPRVHTIIDRREAIGKALSLARPHDAVVLTGKGGEVWMCVAEGKKIPWDERAVVEEKLLGK